MIVTIAAALITAGATPALKPDRGIDASYDAARDRYCLRATRDDPTMPSGVRLYQRSCRSQQQWAREGVTIEHRARG